MAQDFGIAIVPTQPTILSRPPRDKRILRNRHEVNLITRGERSRPVTPELSLHLFDLLSSHFFEAHRSEPKFEL